MQPRRLAECPNCATVHPDPGGQGFCTTCGLIFRDRLTWRLQLTALAVLGGMVLAGGGGYLVLFKNLTALGLLLAAPGAIALGEGLYLLWRQNKALLAALDLRGTRETMRFVGFNDLLCIVLLLFFLAFVSTGIVYAGAYKHSRQRSRLTQAFQAEFANYSKVVDPNDVRTIDAKAVGAPRTIGKLIVLDRQDSGLSISDVQLKLPSELKAEQPHEVGMVVWVDYENVPFGKYQGEVAIPAYRRKATLTLIDPKSKTVIARQSDFLGGDPPAQPPRNGAPGVGPKPIEEMVDYLENLPRDS